MNIFFSSGVKSPAAKLSQERQLTGNIRIIRDSVIDLHNSVQQWNKFCSEGEVIIKEIVSTDDSDSLNELCDRLQRIINEFVIFVSHCFFSSFFGGKHFLQLAPKYVLADLIKTEVFF